MKEILKTINLDTLVEEPFDSGLDRPFSAQVKVTEALIRQAMALQQARSVGVNFEFQIPVQAKYFDDNGDEIELNWNPSACIEFGCDDIDKALLLIEDKYSRKSLLLGDTSPIAYDDIQNLGIKTICTTDAEIVEAAKEAFWNVVAKNHPEVNIATHIHDENFHQACVSAYDQWIDENHPSNTVSMRI